MRLAVMKNAAATLRKDTDTDSHCDPARSVWKIGFPFAGIMF
jgi:hypothetical protein